MLDLSAAFDTIDHIALLNRLEQQFGFSEKPLQWVASYLSDRFQTVSIDGKVSEPVLLTFSVKLIQGTVVPNSPFTAEISAQKLHKAMKGLDTDEKTIIDVMASHTNQQRQEIALAYEKLYDKNLPAELKSEISGNFENLVLALLETPANYDAKEIKFAIKGAGTDEGTLIEILSSRSNQRPPNRLTKHIDMVQIKSEFQRLYGKSLASFIKGDTSGDF
ncbi:annexin A13-like [Dreissena polymorpha]|uniref:annexin A13-like n=1 Tax=Dreissena polymorpha TaxID=45954 RepID=UPI00226497E6|nr:annexin A13-like [Dreissena polymorpha]